MQGIIKLKNTLTINGQEISEVTYNTEKMSVGAYVNADINRTNQTGGKPTFNVPQFDTSLQLYLGFAAIMAENPNIDITDLERIKGDDILEIITVGRNFISRKTTEGASTD